MNQSLPSLAIARSQIRHRRYLPKSHYFSSQLNYLWFDPDQIIHFVQQSPFWSTKKIACLSLNEADFLTQQQGTIREKIQTILRQQAQFSLQKQHQIRILALPRCLGLRFNSVVFYFIYDVTKKLCFILSEITNTPWNERQVYVHDCQNLAIQNTKYQTYQFDFKKIFHVSPFMPMNLDYRWKFSFSDQQNVIYMQLFQNEIVQFDAMMRFSLQPITLPSQQHRYAVCNVFEPCKMVSGIYWNALRLWKKKIPFYRHPKKDKGNTTE